MSLTGKPQCHEHAMSETREHFHRCHSSLNDHGGSSCHAVSDVLNILNNSGQDEHSFFHSRYNWITHFTPHRKYLYPPTYLPTYLLPTYLLPISLSTCHPSTYHLYTYLSIYLYTTNHLSTYHPSTYHLLSVCLST